MFLISLSGSIQKGRAMVDIREIQTNYSTNSIVDEMEASSKLSKILLENKVYLGGSAVGKGFHSATHHILKSKAAGCRRPEYFENEEAKDLNPEILSKPVEESFYVVDLGLVVFQLYQWRKALPRVEPFYAVKCNPDPVIVRTLAILGANFDCASQDEIRLVQELSSDLRRKPEIIYANPCKARSHLIEAVCKGVKLVTFDNPLEVAKCAAVSKKIKLVMRIVTDDRGSVCRLSSKFGAHRHMWRTNLAAAKNHGLKLVGVSFHVGSGCLDASRYELALRDAKEIFTFAKEEFGFEMNIVDIGGGFPGETHSIWNNPDMDFSDEKDYYQAKEDSRSHTGEPQVFFSDIAEKVRIVLDELFPEDSGVRLIAEPGRYFVAASSTLVTSVIGARNNLIDSKAESQPKENKRHCFTLELTPEEGIQVDHTRGLSVRGSMDQVCNNFFFDSINDDKTKCLNILAQELLSQPETDVFEDSSDLAQKGLKISADLLSILDDDHLDEQVVSANRIGAALVHGTFDHGECEDYRKIIAYAEEPAVNFFKMDFDIETTTFQDDVSYYINDGVYGAFKDVVFYDAIVRPRPLKYTFSTKGENILFLSNFSNPNLYSKSKTRTSDTLYTSTLFGPTCDSIDVIVRSTLLPRLEIGDWLYFQNMGAYTNAVASNFNGFGPSERFYVCSMLPEYCDSLIAGADLEYLDSCEGEEKKEES